MQRLPNLSDSKDNPQEKKFSDILALAKGWHSKLWKIFLIPSPPSNGNCEYRSGGPSGRIQVRYLEQNQTSKATKRRRRKEKITGRYMNEVFVHQSFLCNGKKMKTVYISIKGFGKTIKQRNKNKTAKKRDLDLYVSR